MAEVIRVAIFAIFPERHNSAGRPRGRGALGGKSQWSGPGCRGRGRSAGAGSEGADLPAGASSPAGRPAVSLVTRAA